MFKGKVLLFSLVVLFATGLYAGDVDETKSSAWIENGIVTAKGQTLQLRMCPLGDYPPQIWQMGASGLRAAIYVVIRDTDGVGIPGIPVSDYWITPCTPTYDINGLGFILDIENGFLADSMTSSRAGTLGQTTFTGVFRACGVAPMGVHIACQNKIIREPMDPGTFLCLPFFITNLDLWVAGGSANVIDGLDRVAFAATWQKVEGDPAFNGAANYIGGDIPERINLPDAVVFAGHRNHVGTAYDWCGW